MRRAIRGDEVVGSAVPSTRTTPETVRPGVMERTIPSMSPETSSGICAAIRVLETEDKASETALPTRFAEMVAVAVDSDA